MTQTQETDPIRKMNMFINGTLTLPVLSSPSTSLTTENNKKMAIFTIKKKQPHGTDIAGRRILNIQPTIEQKFNHLIKSKG